MFPLAFVVLFSLVFATHIDADVSPIRNLYVPNVTLPENGLRDGYATYNKEISIDCVFILGGWSQLQNQVSNRIYCYNITSNEIYSFYNATYDIYSTSGGKYWINNMFYYYSSGHILSFDFINKEEIIISKPGYSSSTCMAMSHYPNNNDTNIWYFVTSAETTGNNKFYQYRYQMVQQY